MSVSACLSSLVGCWQPERRPSWVHLLQRPARPVPQEKQWEEDVPLAPVQVVVWRYGVVALEGRQVVHCPCPGRYGSVKETFRRCRGRTAAAGSKGRCAASVGQIRQHGKVGLISRRSLGSSIHRRWWASLYLSGVVDDLRRLASAFEGSEGLQI